MNDIERVKLTNTIVNGLKNSIIKEDAQYILENDIMLVSIVNERKYLEIGEKFIVVLIEYDGCDDYYKCLLRILNPKNPDKPEIIIHDDLLDDIKVYLKEGLTKPLQLQVKIHNFIMESQLVWKTPHMEYPIKLDNIYANMSQDEVDESCVVYKQRSDMYVTNKISAKTAHVYSERYCDGNRSSKIIGVIKELDTILVLHSRLYFEKILTKLDQTDCIATSIVYGIGEVLPINMSVHELSASLWEPIIVETIKDVSAHCNIRICLEPNYILDMVTRQLRGTSTFNHRDLVNMVLGYHNLDTTDLVLKAVRRLRAVPPKSYFL